MQPTWLGPYGIRRKETFGTYELITPWGQVLDALVHHDELKPCNVPTIAMAKEKWYEGIGHRRMDVELDGENYDMTRMQLNDEQIGSLTRVQEGVYVTKDKDVSEHVTSKSKLGNNLYNVEKGREHIKVKNEPLVALSKNAAKSI